MKFNPPPNWPQVPAGWTPPRGWKPDPSWPEPPYGWPLWVADDEFVISPHGASSRTRLMPSVQPTEPWYRRPVAVVLFLLFLYPVGLALLWMRRDWSVARRTIFTVMGGIIMITALSVATAPPTTTTTVLTTAAGGTASPSHAPSTKPAAPAPVVTTPRPPVTSAPPPPPPTTAAPAPVQTSAAPAYVPPAPAPTTQAPQPVQTTQAQQGCTPLTDGGKCYEPGEYCRGDDHGVTGIDGDGNQITCEDNDGWRWESS